MSRYRISNEIFNLNLSRKAVVVYAYLLNIHSSVKTINDENVVSVKQSTIAEKCGIGSLQTVRAILNLLAEQSLVTPLERKTKRNKHKGTYEYAVKVLPYDTGYFYVERKVFGQLTPRQMYIYLFLCKAESVDLNYSWNSYNDIAEQTGMKREVVVQTINELAELKHIVRMKRRAKDNKKVYVDNHYQIIKYVVGRIHKKKVRKPSENFRTKCYLHDKDNNTSYYFSTFLRICQVFFQNKGSP